MKRFMITALVTCSLSALIATAGFLGSGYGKKASVTATAERVAFDSDDYVYDLSFNNTGSAEVYVAVNCSLATFTGMVGVASAITIPASTVYSFHGSIGDKKLVKIKSYCYQASTGTQTVYVAGF